MQNSIIAVSDHLEKILTSPHDLYSFLAGKDASRAFVTGELSKSMDNDDVADLSLQEIKSIHDWLNFYHDKYLYKGKATPLHFSSDRDFTHAHGGFLSSH